MRNWWFLFCPLLLASCYEPREGCLDIEATNFDAAADKNCCCTYPALKLTFLPRFDTLVWKPDTAYQYAPGKWFRIKQAVFYLSDFQLLQQGAPARISDSLEFSLLGPAGDTVRQTLINDFQLIRRTVIDYTAGAFRPGGTFESIRFRVGLPASAQRVIPDLAPDGHPLRRQAEGMWQGPDTGYVALKLVITRDSLPGTAPDTLWFSRPDFDSAVIQKDAIFRHESGYDFRLQLQVDFRELFRSVDLSTGDISAWKTQIIANLPGAFSVFP
ncbi:MAG: hypothetical protein IPH12_12260 [Saprospirales bacterium]|jgi:hypothetical protein|nr:hypothetical protein [Saprospirales bacterium]MBK8921139.1 hypothetical protein [Saprospirales bacterium]